MYFITTKRMLEVCFSAHPNIQYRTIIYLRSPRYVEKPRLYNIKEIDSHRLDSEWMVELWEI